MAQQTSNVDHALIIMYITFEMMLLHRMRWIHSLSANFNLNIAVVTDGYGLAGA